tara:strand:+ start:339 stop:863 length:525 start_codon:yes stop_codon:yes gene_type:complete
MTYRFKKIYFNGCSWTWGLSLENPLEQRYSRLLCNHLRAEECNFALVGGSTRRVARHMLEHNMSKYGLVIVQMTYNQRTEYYDGEWKKVKYPMKPSHEFWNRYYKEIYDEKYGNIDEHVYYHFFRSLLKDKPHIIMKIGSDSKSGLPYDIILPGSGHPDEQGHKDICQSILDIL